MSATGLSADSKEYRGRLLERSDDEIDAFGAELMRDLSIRLGVLRVLYDFQRATNLSERELERVYAAGGGSPATMGRTEDGRVMVPAVSLHHLVSGLRRESPDARGQLVDYLVANFHEFVFI